MEQNVEDYQLEPLRRALLSAPTNLLLADDVGLGKTIEAGLKADLKDVKEFRTRELKTLTFIPSKDEVEEFALLDGILAESARRNGRGKSDGIVAMLMKKRSCPARGRSRRPSATTPNPTADQGLIRPSCRLPLPATSRRL